MRIARELPTADQLVRDGACAGEKTVILAERKNVGVTDVQRLRCNAADVSIGVTRGEWIDEVFGSEYADPFVLQVDLKARLKPLVQSCLQCVAVGMKDRIIL